MRSLVDKHCWRGKADLHLLQRHVAHSWTPHKAGNDGCIVGGLKQAPAYDEFQRFLCVRRHGRVRIATNTVERHYRHPSTRYWCKSEHMWQQQASSMHLGHRLRAPAAECSAAFFERAQAVKRVSSKPPFGVCTVGMVKWHVNFGEAGGGGPSSTVKTGVPPHI